MKRFAAAAAALAALLLAVLYWPAALKSGDDGILLLGVSQPNTLEPWQAALKADIASEAEKYEHIKCIYADAGDSAEKQSQDIGDMIQWEVDAIIVFLCNGERLTPKLKEAMDHGIKVIVIGYMPPQSSAYSLRIFVNNYKVGYLAGTFAARLLQGEGVILEMQGNPEARDLESRKRGFLDALAAYPGIVKEYVVVGYGTEVAAAEALENSEILEGRPRIDLLFAHNDEMAVGARSVLEHWGYHIPTIGVDALEKGREALQKGELTATVHYQTLGREAVDYAIRLTDGEELDKCVEYDPVLCTKEELS